MAENLKSISVRFNMEDRADGELYLKLTKEAESTVSLNAYIKRVLEEYFVMKAGIADRQRFHSQLLSEVREEMQEQGMKLVGALLAGAGSVQIPHRQPDAVPKEKELPESCDNLPEKLQGILDFIA